MVKVVEVCELESYAGAVKDANWRVNVEDEMCTLMKNETWDLSDAPKGVQLVGCRWVYKVKYNTNDFVNRFKDRLVPKGYA